MRPTSQATRGPCLSLEGLEGPGDARTGSPAPVSGLRNECLDKHRKGYVHLLESSPCVRC